MKNELPLLILETANSHAGSIDDIHKLIDIFAYLPYERKAIKFQVFKYDRIALESFSWYEVYKELFQEEDKWYEIITRAKNKIGEIWLDLFDTFGVEVFEKNSDLVTGLKLQASVLNNFEVIDALRKLSLANTRLMINVSGYTLDEISSHMEVFHSLNPLNIILQIGYQNYPTEIEDSSLNKIDALKEAFPGYEICYADHISGDEAFSREFPIYAFLRGAGIIEKHICLDRKKARYDGFSSLEFEEMKELTACLLLTGKCLNTDFITKKEAEYLAKSEQKVVVRETLNKGQLVSAKDIVYRRTDIPGLNIREINAIQEQHYQLNTTLTPGSTVREEDFKKARIAVIVAGRMKSSRLKQKAILPIHGIPSVEMCLESCFRFPFVEDVILATSDLEEDAILENYTLKGKAKFHKGHPDDVIHRYLGACDAYNVDVVVRVTADCPMVCSEITEILLKSHFESGADYSGVRDAAVGTFSEIFNTEALRRVIQLLGKADHSEYMTWYMRNNADIFKVNIVDLPAEYIRNYRLTLDYEEDLRMFEALTDKMKELHLEPGIANLFKVLDEHPEIPAINGHLTLKYKTDKELIDFLNKITKINRPSRSE